jgi:hypothetical protein
MNGKGRQRRLRMSEVRLPVCPASEGEHAFVRLDESPAPSPSFSVCSLCGEVENLAGANKCEQGTQGVWAHPISTVAAAVTACLIAAKIRELIFQWGGEMHLGGGCLKHCTSLPGDRMAVTCTQSRFEYLGSKH